MKLFLLKVLLFISCTTYAQWNSATTINTPIVVAPKSQDNVHTITDSKGGAIIAWDDNRNSATGSSDIYAQRVRNTGVVKWSSTGKVICSDIATQKSSSIVDSDNGSAIITWEDNRAGNYDIYAQKIDSSGNVIWTSNGIAVCAKTTKQKNPKIISDNLGGAIIVWEDSVSFYWDVYAQRINSLGVPLWTTGGVGICTSPNTQTNPKIDVDGLGGAVITWQDKRNNVDYDIYAQRVDNSGTALWTLNGVSICNAINTQNNPRIEPDGANGALIAWVDKRNGTDNNIYAQHINSLGIVQWAGNGVSVCNAVNNQSALDIKYIGSTGLVLTWKDDRSGANAIYTQLVSTAGTSQLTTNGLLISNGIKSINPNIIRDGLGGAIIAWQDSTTLSWDIKTQNINASGVVQWTNGGVTVSNAIDDQINVSHVTDGNGGAIFVWEDYRSGSNYDLYANHLYSNGSAFVGIHELTKLPTLQSLCFPNPINTSSIIQLLNTTSTNPWEISVYNSFGNLIETKSLKSYEYHSLNSANYIAGVYFYIINVKNETTYSKGSFISIK